MANYKLKLYTYRKLRDTWEFEFDINDQEKWNKLKDLAESFDIDWDIPKKAPKNPEIWFELLQWLPTSGEPLTCVKHEEMPESGLALRYELQNASGKVIREYSEEDDY